MSLLINTNYYIIQYIFVYLTLTQTLEVWEYITCGGINVELCDELIILEEACSTKLSMDKTTNSSLCCLLSKT